MQGRVVRRTMLQQEAMIERTRSVCREDERLAAAYLSAWEWGRALMASLGNRHGVALPASLAGRLNRRFAETFSATGLEGS